MPWITLLLATAATAVFVLLALLALWLIGPLAEVVHWLEGVDGGVPESVVTPAERVGREQLRV